MAPTAAASDKSGGIPVRRLPIGLVGLPEIADLAGLASFDNLVADGQATSPSSRCRCPHIKPELEPHVYRGSWLKHKGALFIFRIKRARKRAAQERADAP